MKALYQKIRTLNGKNYGLYKSLGDRSWDFGDFSLEFLHVQGDPYAPASRIMVKANLENLGYGSEWRSSFDRRLALSDFLLRRLSACVQERYPEKDGAVQLAMPGPEMLLRNSLWIDNGELRATLQVKLPGDGRKIDAENAAEILTMVLPDLVSAALYNDGHSFPEKVRPELLAHYRMLTSRTAILQELKNRNLVAFVPDGAILPRSSGNSFEPLAKAVPFTTPQELSVTLNIEGREIRGMGIPTGITVITGGAFHGKSTLLQALTCAVYPHIPGDGREGIVIDESAVRIGVEDGRSVRNTDISPLVRDLPGGISTKEFSTSNASGSTSEAANLLEAMEAGTCTFLIDEDSSAVNFLIRDRRVRELLGDEREPLVPLSDRICEMAHPKKDSDGSPCNFIIVAGACGDFLSIADNTIIMANYRAECATSRVKSLFENSKRSVDASSEFSKPKCRDLLPYIQPLLQKLRPTSLVERQVKVKLSGEYLLQMGFLQSDTRHLLTLFDKQQRLGAGFILLNLCQNAVSNADKKSQTIAEAIEELYAKIRNVGFRNIPQGMSREMSLPRPIDIACALYRLCER